jgi:cytochrome c6
MRPAGLRRRWRAAVLSAIGLIAGFTGQSLQAADAAEMALGKQLFTTVAVPQCAICHTLRDAGSAGAVGPILDELKPDASRVAAALRTGIGAMPSYAKTLTEAQIQALAVYVSTASGGSP